MAYSLSQDTPLTWLTMALSTNMWWSMLPFGQGRSNPKWAEKVTKVCLSNPSPLNVGINTFDWKSSKSIPNSACVGTCVSIVGYVELYPRARTSTIDHGMNHAQCRPYGWKRWPQWERSIDSNKGIVVRMHRSLSSSRRINFN